jgi:uncharacterized protein with PhoU and TrkA domain
MSDPEDYANLDHIDMSVRELLTEMKDTSEVIVDLAYASLMYNSQPMAEKVHDLEDEMDNLKFAIRYKVLLSSRTKDDAKQLSGLLQVASAADRISDAAADMVDLLGVPAERRPFMSSMLSESDEKIRMLKVKPCSDMVGYTIDQLAVEACTGCKIIAVKNRQGWTYDPEDSTKLRANDDIIVRGTEDGYSHLIEFSEGKVRWEFPEASDEEDEEDEEEEGIIDDSKGAED